MNNKRKLIISCFLLLIIFIGIYRFGYFSKSDKTNFGFEKKIEDKTEFYEITARYPSDKLDKNNIIEEFVFSQVEQKKEEWKIGGELYKQEEEAQKQFPDRPKMVYSFDLNYQKFSSDKAGTVSYLFNIYEYAGGANGQEKVQSFTFDKDGLVNVESILDISGYHPNSKDVNKPRQNDILISELILEETKNDKEQYPDSNLTREGLGLSYLENDGVTLNHKKCNCDGWFFGSNLQNFVPTDSGLVFYFDECKITTCSAGVVGVSLSWETLSPFLVNNLN